MISFYLFLIVVLIVLGNMLIFNFKDKVFKDFLLSVFFLWNSLFVIILLQYVYNKLSVFEYQDFSQIEVILSLNSSLINYKNTLIVCVLIYLVYGFYSQYIASKKKVYFVLTVIMSIISLLMLCLSLLAGSFII